MDYSKSCSKCEADVKLVSPPELKVKINEGPWKRRAVTECVECGDIEETNEK